MFENIGYGSYPGNTYFNDLPLEYEESWFKKRPIYILTNNIIERLKVSLIELSLYNIIYKSDPKNADFYDLCFDGNKRLITRRRKYRIQDDIVSRLKIGSTVYVKTNKYNNNKLLVRCID